MYHQHFGLTGDPFSLTPDPDCFYPSPQHREAMAALEYGLMERRGFITLVGEVGTGKTTVLYSVLSRLGYAALDVYDREPLPADHPLRRAPCVLLTPHIGYVTDENYRNSYPQIIENVLGFLDGRPVRVIGG